MGLNLKDMVVRAGDYLMARDVGEYYAEAERRAGSKRFFDVVYNRGSSKIQDYFSALAARWSTSIVGGTAISSFYDYFHHHNTDDVLVGVMALELLVGLYALDLIIRKKRSRMLERIDRDLGNRPDVYEL